MTFNKSILSILAASTLASVLFIPSNSAFAQSSGPREYGYHCNGSQPTFYQPLRQWIKERTTHITQQRFVLKRVHQWDARYIREGCERLARGEAWDDSCLNGRRNLEEIAETLPDNLSKMPFQEVNKFAATVNDREEYAAAFEFCRAQNIYR